METWKSALPEAIRSKFENFSDDAEGLSKLGGSYIETKSMVGGRIPKPDPDNIEGMNEIFNKLGRPETFDKYDVKYEVGDGVDIFKPMMEVFHQAGVSNKQMQTIIDKFGEVQTGLLADMDAADQTSFDESINSLKSEWGQAYDQKREAAINAARTIMGDDYAERLASSSDIDAFKGFDKQAAEMGEAGNYGGDRTSFRLTPDEAKLRMSEIRNDTGHAFHKGDPAALKEMNDLTEATVENNEVLFTSQT